MRSAGSRLPACAPADARTGLAGVQRMLAGWTARSWVRTARSCVQTVWTRRTARESGLAGLLGVLMALVLPGAAAAAEPTYRRYTDAQGVVHVTPVQAAAGGRASAEELPGSGGGRTGPEAASEHEAGEARRDPLAEVTEALADERARRYETHIRGAARLYQLPESLLRAVIHTESNYYPGAVSGAGAMGLTQLMPSTARFLGVQQPFDPRQSIYGGARFLRLLANRFGGDMVLVLAGYFSGAGAVQKYGGVPPHAGVRAYVKAVLRRFYAYERVGQGGSGGASPARAIAGP